MAKFADRVDKIACGVTEGYKKIENGVVGAYKKVEDAFVDTSWRRKVRPPPMPRLGSPLTGRP